MDLNLEKYIRQLKSGNKDAFDKVYELTYRKIFFVVLPILHDKSLAEDIMQDTYLKFLEKLYDYKSSNSLAYILTIARNLAINEYNKRKREVKVFDSDMDNFSFDAYLEISVENKELIKKALSILNSIERNIFLLHNLENLKHKEIALILNKPLGTITWTYQQAIRKMRKHLKE
ncbi:RNA polymerase sigma factor [Candidatus Izemoplasma sp. B36]|uniref:RNA polymerase sigma factor n=1 Tax=Candidatus Izemoplasma sp. B36 TaxID=3242468 RepID=UPI0035578E60